MNHGLFLEKADSLLLDPIFFQLLHSYFENRFEFVQIDDVSSSFLLSMLGIGQGTSTGCNYFNFYVNSIFKLKLYGKILLYADDCALVYGEDSLEVLKWKMEEDLKTLRMWSEFHFFEMNLLKTNYILFRPRISPNPQLFDNFSVEFSGVSLPRVSSTRYLGLIIDNELSWIDHIQNVRKRVSPMIFALNKIRKYISEEVALKIYFSHIYCHFNYMNPLWNVATQEAVSVLEVLQKKCLKIIYLKPYNCPSVDLFNLRTIPLELLNRYNLLVLAFKIKHNLITNNVSVQRIGEIHNYNTRRVNDFYVYRYSTHSFGLADFYTRGLIAFNELSDREKSIQSLNEFKKSIKVTLMREWSATMNQRSRRRLDSV